MGTVVAFQDRPLPPARAMQRIRELWNTGEFDWGFKHAEKRMIERGIDNLDMENLVQKGRVVGGANKPSVLSDWRYRVEGKTVEGQWMAAIFEVRKESMTVVTVLS